MKAEYKLADIEKTEATLTITMPISEWKELNEQLSAKWPAWKLSEMIDRIIRKANSEFAEEIDGDF